MFKYCVSADKLDQLKINAYLGKLIGNNELSIKSQVSYSNLIFFFLTNKFVKTGRFKKEWNEREKRVFIVVLLEEINENMADLDVNDFYVSNLYDTTLEKNKIFIQRLMGLVKIETNKKHDVIYNKFSSNVTGINSERLIVKYIELIDSDEVILKISDRQNIEKILIINWKKSETIGILGNIDIRIQQFFWIKHLNQIFCYQKDKCKMVKEAKCSLFSKRGNLIRSVYSIDTYIHEVNSIFYNISSLHVYLNVFNKSNFKKSVIVLNEDFNMLHIINEELFNSRLPCNYLSEIKLLKTDYKMFHYNSNIAFLQKNDTNKNIYIFDKLSHSIIDSFKTDSRLISVLGDKMLFKSRSSYLIQKVPFPINSEKFKHFDAFCTLNPFKKPHLLSNPKLLPCGKFACLKCIYRQYNLFKQCLSCALCNQEHKLTKQLEETNESTRKDFVSQNLIHMIIDENKKLISVLSILTNFL